MQAYLITISSSTVGPQQSKFNTTDTVILNENAQDYESELEDKDNLHH